MKQEKRKKEVRSVLNRVARLGDFSLVGDGHFKL
jgi:chromosome condensin MukBEF MukE localization factor